MPKFAVFFADDAAVGVTRVEASDAAAAFLRLFLR